MDKYKFGTKEWAEHNQFKDNPHIKWKESIKKMLGLPDESTA